MSAPEIIDGLYIGLMSGTSIDAVDVALVEFVDRECHLATQLEFPIPDEIKQKLANLSSPIPNGHTSPPSNRIEKMANLDVIMGELFANACLALLEREAIPSSKIMAIGSHGQTIRHRPTKTHPFTLQIGDPNIIAERTNITTVADFRRMDIAAGGQGAPLTPAFHNNLLRSSSENRIILNLGGIANISVLFKDANQPVIGFDTGPANTLLDNWYKKNHPTCTDGFDQDSLFAETGEANSILLSKLMTDPYFELPYPKSTGREYFSIEWLQSNISSTNCEVSPADIQRTLVQLTSVTIANAVKNLDLSNYQIYACGGGMHNEFLLSSIGEQLGKKVKMTNDIGVNGDYLEAMTFAWLAKCRLAKKPGNLPSVTGAKKPKILGSIYLP